MAKAKQSRLTSELLEAASEMRSLGILSKPAHDKITKRHLNENSVVIKPIKAGEIKVLRERAHMS